jgi:hypothetical protein
MAKIVLQNDTNPMWAKDVEVDTAAVLAVQHLGFIALSNGGFAHRRAVYTGETLMTVWQESKSKDVPSTMAILDNLGGKPYVDVAKSASYGSGNAGDLASANGIRISIADDDLKFIKKADAHGSMLATGTGVNGAFTRSAKPETLPPNTVMNYARLNVGQYSVPVAHLDGNRFAKFEAV